ncbi:MAG: NAD+ synthase, partial [Promethearchaeota archaeon]
MKSVNLNIVIGQINPTVGDIESNAEKVIDVIKKYQEKDIIIFPEMALVGYPIMDHIHDPLIKRKNFDSLEKIKNVKSKATIILGTFTEPKELEG